ncbi:hypothetical protein H9P43_009707 [Blastocladiella emersonii ATCC 22665]|nr:hypothetical protein H9P43_009707 [Blastocladiella emersonii ATCC 22665]
MNPLPLSAALTTADQLDRDRPPGTSRQPYVSAPRDALPPAESAVLNEHVDRVHSLFLDMVDSQLSSAYRTLQDREDELDRVETERKHAMVSLGHAWCEVDRVNHLVATLNEKLHATSQSEALASIERGLAVKDVERAESTNAALRHDVAKIATELAEATKRIDQMRQINVAFTADLKVQKRIQSKLKKEKEVVERQRKDVENELAFMQKKFEQVVNEKNDLAQRLAEQQNETKVAQNAIGRMSHEISKATQVKQILEKQWEDAVNAMSKRDHTLKAMDEAKDAVKQELTTTQVVLRNTTLDQERTQDLLEQREKELDECRRVLDATTNELLHLREEYGTKRTEAHNALDAVSKGAQAFEVERRARERAEAEADRIRVQCAELQSALLAHRQDLQVNANEAFAAKVVREQDARTQAVVGERDRALEAQVEANIHLQHSNAELALQVKQLQEQLEARDKEHSLLQSKNHEVTGHAEKLCYETQMLSYRLEKKDMELSGMRMNQTVVDTRPLEMVIKNLEREVSDIKRERDRTQAAWLKIQQNNVQLQERVDRLQSENDTLKTKSIVNSMTNVQVNEEVKGMKREAFEKNMQVTQLYVELQKLRPRMQELENRNAVQEAQLAHYAMQLEESAHGAKSAVHMLKHDLRRVHKDRAGLQRDQFSRERAYAALEQKYTLTRELLDKTREDKNALLRQNAELKAKCDAWSAKLDEIKGQWRKLVELGGKRVMRRADGKPHEDEGRQGSALELAPQEYEVVDVPGLKLRNETLTVENRHMHEEVVLKDAKIRELEDRIMRLDMAASNLSLRAKSLDSQLASQAAALTMATQRASRAERIAAYLEFQFRDAKPNGRVDYGVALQEDVEASPALQAAFIKLNQTAAAAAAAASAVKDAGGTAGPGGMMVASTPGGPSKSRTRTPLGLAAANAKLPPLSPGPGAARAKRAV